MVTRYTPPKGLGLRIPPEGPERDRIGRKAVELSKSGVSYHNIALALQIPFGSISRLIKHYREETLEDKVPND